MSDDTPYAGQERRKSPSAEISNLHRRMDTQDELLREIRDKIVAHMAAEEVIKPSVDELVAILHGSKVTVRVLGWITAGAAGLFAVIGWAKDHVKW